MNNKTIFLSMSGCESKNKIAPSTGTGSGRNSETVPSNVIGSEMNSKTVPSTVTGRARKSKIVPLIVDEKMTPLHSRYLKVERQTDIWANFHIIFIAAMLTGVPIPNSLWKTKRRALNSCLAAWNRFIILFRTAIVVLYLGNSRQYWPTTTTQITYNVQNLAGYVPIWIFCAHSGRIESTLKNLLSMSPPLRSREKRRSLSIKIILLLGILTIALFTWTAVTFFYIGAFDFIAARLNPGVPSLQDVHYYFTSAVIFSFMSSYHMGTATLYVQLLLCCQAYWSCGRLLRHYGRQLQERTKTSPERVAIMLAKFKNVSSCIRSVDQTLGECPLTIYIYVMNDVFTVMSSLFSKDRKHGSSLEYNLYLLVRALSAMAIYLYLTNNADAVTREKRALQERMVRISQSMMRPETSSRLAATFCNLYGSVRSTELCVTCFDLFDINRKNLLSGAGVFITYGIYLYQYAATENEEDIKDVNPDAFNP